MDNQVIDLCWKLFASTGKVSYYMLYHQLQSIDMTKEAEKEEERETLSMRLNTLRALK